MIWVMLVAAACGGTPRTLTPREVDPTDTAVEARPRQTPRLVAGADHTCLLAATPGPRTAPICWGTHGATLMDAADRDLSPTRVPVLRGATTVAAATAQTCAIVAGRVQCIRGRFGQDPEPAVTHIEGIAEPASRIDSSRVDTCAIGADGGVYCWRNFENEATRVAEIETAREIAVTANGGCAIVGDGQVSCWGGVLVAPSAARPPDEGQRPRGELVAGVASARQIDGGADFACAVLHDGRVVCFGRGEGASYVRDFVGRESEPATGAATPIAGIADALQVSAGLGHACVVRRGGEVLCWGANAYGELGDGTMEAQTRPVPSTAFAGAIEIAAGLSHTCALLPNDVVRCAGYEVGGARAGEDPTEAAVEVSGVTASWIAAAARWTCTGRTDQTAPLACWGDFGGARGFAARIARREMSIHGAAPAELQGQCALSADRTARCWPWLPPEDGEAPIVEHPRVARMVHALGQGACAIGMDGRIACGRAGEGPIVLREVVAAPRGATDLAIFGTMVLAVDRDRRLWGWTFGERPQRLAALRTVAEVEVMRDLLCMRFIERGAGEETSSVGCAQRVLPANPASFAPLDADVEGLTAGGRHMCGIESGHVRCWSDAERERVVSWQVGRIEDARQIAVGDGHGCALRTTGSVACWGEGSRGELGAIPPYVTATPVEISLPPFD